MDKVTSARSFLEYYFKKSGPWSETLQSQTTVFVDTEHGGKKPNINVNMLRAVALPNQVAGRYYVAMVTVVTIYRGYHLVLTMVTMTTMAWLPFYPFLWYFSHVLTTMTPSTRPRY